MIKVYWLYSDENSNISTDGYVGVTKNIKIRMYQHKSRFKNFKFKIIFYGSLEQCLALELQLRPSPGIGWNKAIGGFEGYRLGHCEETINIIKEKRKTQRPPCEGRKQPLEEIERRRKSQLGQKRSPEAIANMKGRKQSPELKEKLRLINTGKKHNDEMKAKVTAALTGRHVSEETKRKISEAQKGKIITPEQRRNMSDAKWAKKGFTIDPTKVIVWINHCSIETMAIVDAEAETVK